MCRQTDRRDMTELIFDISNFGNTLKMFQFGRIFVFNLKKKEMVLPCDVIVQVKGGGSMQEDFNDIWEKYVFHYRLQRKVCFVLW